MHRLLNKNLNALLIKSNLTSKALADAIKVPTPTINRLRSDSDVNPTINSLIPICRYFKVTIDQLLGFSSLTIDDEGKEQSPLLHAVPLLKCEAVPHFKIQNKIKDGVFIYTELSADLDLFAMHVQATCWKVFQKDSVIFISTNTTPKNDDYVVVYSVNDSVVGIKQLIVDVEGIYLKSLNDSVDTVKLTAAYKIAGVIVQAKHNFNQS